jgi:catechol 2,3-dioxygenase-like lactoylglutathione lyase family enzyme
MATVRYIVREVDESIEFYRAILGFELLQQYGSAMAILRRDDLELWLAGPLSSAGQALPTGEQPSSGGWNRIVLLFTDVREVLIKLQSHGATILQGVSDGHGGKRALCEDPSGNLIELFELVVE